MWLVTYYIGLAAGFWIGYKAGKDVGRNGCR